MQVDWQVEVKEIPLSALVSDAAAASDSEASAGIAASVPASLSAFRAALASPISVPQHA